MTFQQAWKESNQDIKRIGMITWEGCTIYEVLRDRGNTKSPLNMICLDYCLDLEGWIVFRAHVLNHIVESLR